MLDMSHQTLSHGTTPTLIVYHIVYVARCGCKCEEELLSVIHNLCRGLLRTQLYILLPKRVGVLGAPLRLVERRQVLQRLQVRAENLPLAFGVIQPQAAPRQVEQIGDLAAVARGGER